MRLTIATVADYLRRRGVLFGGEAVEVEELAGGVSSVALLVRGERRGVVVKQALAKLRVQADWRADPRRTLVEAAALRAYGALTPAAVPAVLDVDEEAFALTMEALPARMRPWKPLLLAGEADDRVAARLGATLARWHAHSARDAAIRAPFSGQAVFRELRVAPFYETVASSHPDLAPAIERTVERMLGDRRCLVHGDFSPKNVLVDDERVVVLDCEVAHAGDPAFDVAFMLHHLALKAIARPADAGALRSCLRAFLDAYGKGARVLGLDEDHVARQTACLMLARVDGKSPVDYLDETGRERVRRVTREALLAPRAPRLADLWSSHGARV